MIDRSSHSKAAVCFKDSFGYRIKSVVPLDPRIHFALNCGANSCPPIGVYSGTNLQRQLQMASNSFLESTVAVGSDSVTLSKLLLWYRSDFGVTDKQVLEKVADFMYNPDVKKALMQAAEKETKIEYSAYDWALNSSS